MSDYVPAALRRLARDRAGAVVNTAAFTKKRLSCHTSRITLLRQNIAGETEKTNLAWTCFVCNRAKGSDLSSIDVETGQLVRLFNPRTDNWDNHFVLEQDGRISAQADIGRVTEFLLKLNQP
jgi:hypothetical protein